MSKSILRTLSNTDEVLKSLEWNRARKIVNHWLRDQLRPEGRTGIYIDDEASLIYEITLELIKARKKKGRTQ